MNTIGLHNIDPYSYFWQSLSEQIAEWISEGEELIIAGNINEEVLKTDIIEFFNNLKLLNN